MFEVCKQISKFTNVLRFVVYVNNFDVLYTFAMDGIYVRIRKNVVRKDLILSIGIKKCIVMRNIMPTCLNIYTYKTGCSKKARTV